MYVGRRRKMTFVKLVLNGKYGINISCQNFVASICDSQEQNTKKAGPDEPAFRSITIGY